MFFSMKKTNAHSKGITEVRSELLHLHKLCIDQGRIDFEETQRKVSNPGEWIQILIADPFFAWLHPFSQLITLLDELLEIDREISEVDARAVRAEVENLIGDFPTTPTEFRTKYLEMMQKHPNVVIQHSKLKLSLQNLPKTENHKVHELLHIKNQWKSTTVKINPKNKRIN